MNDSNAGWYGTILGDGARPKPGPLASAQYGPAHVADVTTGTTHEQRIDALNEAGWTNLPSDPDATAKTYARLLAAQAEGTA